MIFDATKTQQKLKFLGKQFGPNFFKIHSHKISQCRQISKKSPFGTKTFFFVYENIFKKERKVFLEWKKIRKNVCDRNKMNH